MSQIPFRRFAAVCALAVLAACADQQPVAPPAPAAPEGDLAAQLAAMGFRPDMIVDEGEHFRVESDIITPSATWPVPHCR